MAQNNMTFIQSLNIWSNTVDSHAEKVLYFEYESGFKTAIFPRR
jgi:hypothetical protein